MSTLSFLPLQETTVPSHATPLIDTFLSNSSWIWTPEDADIYVPPLAPGNSQRAFRRTWTNTSPSTKVASSTTIVITADNYFELFVNGILVHAANDGHIWEDPMLFTVPISAAVPNKVTYAIRAVNKYSDDGAPKASSAGLRAAIRVDFAPSANAPSEVFSTGVGQGWVASRIFGSGWEQVEFDDGGWMEARDVLTGLNGTTPWSALRKPARLSFASAVPIGGAGIVKAAPTPSSDGWGGVGPGEVVFEYGQLGGMLFGVVMAAGLVGSLISFLLVRRRYTMGRVF